MDAQIHEREHTAQQSPHQNCGAVPGTDAHTDACAEGAHTDLNSRPPILGQGGRQWCDDCGAIKPHGQVSSRGMAPHTVERHMPHLFKRQQQPVPCTCARRTAAPQYYQSNGLGPAAAGRAGYRLKGLAASSAAPHTHLCHQQLPPPLLECCLTHQPCATCLAPSTNFPPTKSMYMKHQKHGHTRSVQKPAALGAFQSAHGSLTAPLLYPSRGPGQRMVLRPTTGRCALTPLGRQPCTHALLQHTTSHHPHPCCSNCDLPMQPKTRHNP
mmetsp:Transcript_32410/g.82330  ORF Transcript_32410/g.82330 Transcript_32410/m.82330 type:complete len:269 (+) Transcript_32410:752-1558(+)